MPDTKIFVCPMSKNIVDAVLELNSDQIGLIPTRRQIDYNDGYVNGWRTKEFFEYVRAKSNIVIERDHGGGNQGNALDTGLESFRIDSKYFDIIHIDPWKTNKSFLDGVDVTTNFISMLHHLNPKLKFEIGTEEDIKILTRFDLEGILLTLKKRLTHDAFESIEYVVVQSGTSLDLTKKQNIGLLNEKKFIQMVNMAQSYGKKTKEHNGDYLTKEGYEFRFSNGLSAINIGPEIIQLEISTYLEYMSEDEINKFYDICLASGKWQRWYSGEITLLEKPQLIEICGHYNLNNFELPKIDDIIKDRIKNKLINLLEYAR